ncbi:hypothetical protein LTR62_007264 [Meristemomyces frigidus]|uniref:A to I editase domain-containing protein n=1 Tax=Meristemomyces frigidus TaxID=1508187 RepID=A0AAN7TJ14_9PEZI|nr:hypothetical protein LTR62_007264 [Meristemomyces frigidus]
MPQDVRQEQAMICVSVATGTKCLPHEKLGRAKGNVLHDWHAEILALRGLSRWLVDECMELAREGRDGRSEWVRWTNASVKATSEEDRRKRSGIAHEQGSPLQHSYRHNEIADNQAETPQTTPTTSPIQPFSLLPNTKIHLYISSAPCGDASMELTMRSQTDSTPWEAPPPSDTLPGRGNFDLLGVVRRKPARADAPMVWSKSCSDKIALRQCTGIVSGVVAHGEGGLVPPLYLDSLILPHAEIVPEAIERCFGFGPQGRMHVLQNRTWEAGYSVHPLRVEATSRIFEFDKPSSATDTAEKGGLGSSNLSLLATPTRQETLINGVLQGRKQSDIRGASCVSRRRLWEDVRAVRRSISTSSPDSVNEGRNSPLCEQTYEGMKTSLPFTARETVRREVWALALKGWRRNEGDEEWTL